MNSAIQIRAAIDSEKSIDDRTIEQQSGGAHVPNVEDLDTSRSFVIRPAGSWASTGHDRDDANALASGEKLKDVGVFTNVSRDLIGSTTTLKT